ncbi:hypothetical protein [Erythrobacter sp. YT30]|nr:hypothetical protein [Erythrobacter sp. YT30]
MSRQFILPAIFTVMVIGMTIFPDRSEVFGAQDDASDEITTLASADPR